MEWRWFLLRLLLNLVAPGMMLIQLNKNLIDIAHMIMPLESKLRANETLSFLVSFQNIKKTSLSLKCERDYYLHGPFGVDDQ